MSRIVPIVVIFFTSCLSLAQNFDTVVLNKEEDEFTVKDTYIFSDTTNKLSNKDIINLPFESWTKKILNGYSPNNEWVLTSFLNNSTEEISKVFYIGNPICHSLEIFVFKEEKLTRVIPSGIRNSKSNKLYNDPGYPYLIKFPTKSETKILIKAKDPLSTIQIPLYLFNEKKALAQKDMNIILLFFWLGTLTISLIVSLLLFIRTNQSIFKYYALFIVASAIIITASTGLILLFVDSDPYQIITNYYQWGAVLIIYILPRFINSLVPIFSLQKTVAFFIKKIAYIGLTIAILYSIPFFKFSFFFTKFFISSVVSLTAITFFHVLIMLFIASFKKIPRAKSVFLVYFIYLSLGFINIILPLLGLSSLKLFSAHIVLIGSVIEMVVFLIFIGDITIQVYRDRQKLLEQVQDHQKMMMKEIVRGQEKERSRYARDLHDGFGQMISILNMNLQGLGEKPTTEEQHQVYENSKGVIDEMYTELKNICFDLMPQTLIKNGLTNALEEFASRVNAPQKVFLELNVFGLDERLNEVQEISLYRIIQEWVNNILKYSDATKITVQLTKDQQELNLLIEDNGMGFDSNLLKQGKGNGWKNMNTRANLINGEIILETKENVRGNTFILDAILEKISEIEKTQEIRV